MEQGVWEAPSVYFLTKRQDAEGEGRVMSPRTLKIRSLNVCGCSALDGKRKVIARIFVEQKLDVLSLSEPNLKGKFECALVLFG